MAPRKDKPSVDTKIGGEAQTDPRGQTEGDTPQPQVQTVSGAPQALEGDTQVTVNPRLSTESVTIPTGQNDDGTTKFDTFVVGKQYGVDPKLVDLKNTEEVPYFVEVGGE